MARFVFLNFTLSINGAFEVIPSSETLTAFQAVDFCKSIDAELPVITTEKQREEFMTTGKIFPQGILAYFL